ncbi:response regulator [Draconibacterium sp. IB214405]|uniref:response regulator n=1 Tax=Draconibacterium sp. IB214405 TaxID=3097352 RepID=UPI002A0BADA0|nr:response regulator [Draconibacterium sp. IB214405]MDX8337929.1 response regulator [Draconibacterium sp. IB214405]
MNKEQKNIFAPILVVEDNPDHARMIIRTLKKKSNLMNEIIHFSNGQEVLDYFFKMKDEENSDQPNPILILLDVKMPIKNGFEVLEGIRAEKKCLNIPIVMLTTTANSEDVAKALKLGANDYIVKPLKYDEFTEKIAKLGYYWGVISDTKKAINDN